MRKFLISAALAASTLAVAAPAAAAQWQQPVPQAYGIPEGYGYGYRDYGFAGPQAYHNRISQIQRQIRNLDQRDILSRAEARKLMSDSDAMHRRVQNLSRFGLNSNEARDLQYRIARLEQKVFKEARDRDRHFGNPYRDGRYGYNDQYGYNGQTGYNRQYGYNNGWTDRDRDGRDDRYEDDRGYRHD